MQKQKIREVMTPNPFTLKKSASISDAAQAMRDQNCGAIIVTEENGRVCGILTDRDIVVRAIADGAKPEQTQVGSVCSADIALLTPDDSVDDAIKLMANKAIRRIPIVENDKPAGIVSLGDLAQVRDKQSVLGGISSAPPNA